MTRNVKFLVGAVVVGLVALLATVLLTRSGATVQPLDPATGDTTGVEGTLPAVTAPTASPRWSDTADAAFTTWSQPPR